MYTYPVSYPLISFLPTFIFFFEQTNTPLKSGYDERDFNNGLISFIWHKVMITCAISRVSIGRISNRFCFCFFSVFTLFFDCLRFLPSEQMELSAGKEVYKVDAERPIWVDARAWELFFRGGICSSPIESNTAHLSHPIHPLSCNHFSGLLQVEKKLKIRCSSDVLKLTNMCFLSPLFPHIFPFGGNR